jgi:hypothetical protein
VLIFDPADDMSNLDGGTGIDTLRFAGGGRSLDLTVASPAGIETIDLTGAGENGLTLDAAALIALSSETDTLRVDGNAGDAVHAGGGWLYGGNIASGGHSYARYTQGSATLELDTDVARDIGFSIDLSSLAGANGFRLSGAAASDQSGRSVSAAGDVNGDGLGDLIVGAYGSDPNGNLSGASYVVFGKAGGFAANVDLSGLNGANGFRLSGAAAGDQSGRPVSGAGDVNGDGFGDLIVGSAHADPNGSDSGASYVVFGKAGGFAADVDLSLSGASGFKLSGGAAGDRSGASVSAAGDVNGDGFGDLIVGAFGADPNGSTSGSSYVVFGGDFGGNLPAASEGTAGNDSLAGTSAAEVLLGNLGNDTLDGGAGADVLHGGAGNDVFIFDGADRVVDGGGGVDTLRFAGVGQSLHLTALGSQGIGGIERIDLSGSGDNALQLTAAAVIGLSDTGNRLIIEGNSGDSVTSTGQDWVFGGEVEIGGLFYDSYAQGAAQLLVNADIDQFIS